MNDLPLLLAGGASLWAISATVLWRVTERQFKTMAQAHDRIADDIPIYSKRLSQLTADLKKANAKVADLESRAITAELERDELRAKARPVPAAAAKKPAPKPATTKPGPKAPVKKAKA